jgi:hypothetical protein
MTAQLETTAQAMVADGKGILAADESTPTITKRFDSIAPPAPRHIAATIARCCSVPPRP